MKTNTPDMNIVNQINAGLNDVRDTLISLSEYGKTPDITDRIHAQNRVNFQLYQIQLMISEHRDRIQSIPWSDRKYIVDEEFS